MTEIILSVLAGLVIGGAIWFPLGIRYRKKVSEREISSAEEEGRRIINEAIKSAETKKKEALLEAKEEILKNRSEHEKEVKERRSELQRQENRLQQKEENIDRKTEAIEKKRTPWPRSTSSWTGRPRKSKPLSAARRKCWSASPASPRRRPRPISSPRWRAR